VTRFDLVTNYRAGSSIEEMERADDGEWVRYEDVVAEQARLRTALEGQPIETCPKDRSWFLAWDADCGFYTYRDGPGLIEAENERPTHWWPLPLAPSAPTPKD